MLFPVSGLTVTTPLSSRRSSAQQSPQSNRQSARTQSMTSTLPFIEQNAKLDTTVRLPHATPHSTVVPLPPLPSQMITPPTTAPLSSATMNIKSKHAAIKLAAQQERCDPLQDIYDIINMVDAALQQTQAVAQAALIPSTVTLIKPVDEESIIDTDDNDVCIQVVTIPSPAPLLPNYQYLTNEIEFYFEAHYKLNLSEINTLISLIANTQQLISADTTTRNMNNERHSLISALSSLITHVATAIVTVTIEHNIQEIHNCILYFLQTIKISLLYCITINTMDSAFIQCIVSAIVTSKPSNRTLNESSVLSIIKDLFLNIINKNNNNNKNDESMIIFLIETLLLLVKQSLLHLQSLLINYDLLNIFCLLLTSIKIMNIFIKLKFLIQLYNFYMK